MTSEHLYENFEQVLAIYPNSKGYAYVLMEGPTEVIDKKMVSVSPVNNIRILNEVKNLIDKYNPNSLILEDTTCKFSRKGSRGKQLLRSISSSAKHKGIQVFSYTREDVRFVFEIWKAKNKFEIAGFDMLLYPKPKYPNSQKYLTALFDAVSLGITHYYKTT